MLLLLQGVPPWGMGVTLNFKVNAVLPLLGTYLALLVIEPIALEWPCSMPEGGEGSVLGKTSQISVCRRPCRLISLFHPHPS